MKNRCRLEKMRHSERFVQGGSKPHERRDKKGQPVTTKRVDEEAVKVVFYMKLHYDYY